MTTAYQVYPNLDVSLLQVPLSDERGISRLAASEWIRQRGLPTRSTNSRPNTQSRSRTHSRTRFYTHTADLSTRVIEGIGSWQHVINKPTVWLHAEKYPITFGVTCARNQTSFLGADSPRYY